MRTVSVPAGRQVAPTAPKRLLALRGDDHLVEQIRRGSEAAFEVVFERYGSSILSFCRHMLGSQEEAEDAVQHTFAAAYRDLLHNEREINLKPWLYAIARNRCLSVLRSGRETPEEEVDGVALAGLDEQVQKRAELRDLVRDMRDLPNEQRAALLLAELGDLSHPEVADVLDCEVQKVKALVFRARSGLMERREARETPCAEIQEQLANLRGGALRRSELRHHLRGCEACRSYREQVRRQRQLVAAILPVTPSFGFKSSVLAAVGIGGGAAGGGAAGLGVLGLSSATVAKIAAVAMLAGGGIVGSEALLDGSEGQTGQKHEALQAAESEGVGGGVGAGLRADGQETRSHRAAGFGNGVRARRRARQLVAGKQERRHVPTRRGRKLGLVKRLGGQQPAPPARGLGAGDKGASGGVQKPVKKVKDGVPPNPSPNANGRGTPETAPPAKPHSEDVLATPPPGQVNPEKIKAK